MNTDELTSVIKQLLKEEPINIVLIQEKLGELKSTLDEMIIHPSFLGEIALPTDELIKHGLYQEALDLLLNLRENLETIHGAGIVYFDIGVCYFYLKKYQKSYNAFMSAISDDEDFRDEAYPYLKKMKKY